MSAVDRRPHATSLWRGLWLGLVVLGVLGGIMHLRKRMAGDAGADVSPGTIRVAPVQRVQPRHPLNASSVRRAATMVDPVSQQPATSLAGLSLRGTEVDGRLRVDARGRLIVEPEVLQLFDYFFTLDGELSEEAIVARIEAEIARRLHDPAASQALALLHRYVAYRRDGRGLSADPAALTAAQRIDMVHDLRVEHFGEQDAASLFGAEEQQARLAAEQARVALDPELSDAERDSELAMLAEQRPAAEQQSYEQARVALSLREHEATLREAGADGAALHAQRVAALGPEAADRLAALDARRRAWRERVDALLAERDRLTATLSDPAQREQAIADWVQQHFSPAEQLRLRAFVP